MKMRGGRRRSLGPVAAAPIAVHPDVAFPHGANGVALHQFDDAAIVVGSVNLRAHLCGYLRLDSRFRHHARFPNRVGQRLLAVDVFAEPQRRHRRQGMRVLRRADNDRVEQFRVVVELAEIHVLFGPPISLRRLVQALLIHIDERHDVLAGHAGGVAGAAPAGADDGHVQLLVWRPALGPLQAAGDPKARSGRRCLKKLATIRSLSHDRPSMRRRIPKVFSHLPEMSRQSNEQVAWERA